MGGKRKAEEAGVSGASGASEARGGGGAGRVYLVAPGAGGGTPEGVVRVLQSFPGTSAVEVVPPVKAGSKRVWDVAAVGRNVGTVWSAIEAAVAKHGGQRVTLVGHSFGCRVLAAVLADDRGRAERLCEPAVVFSGYPLFATRVPKKTGGQRVEQLTQLARDGPRGFRYLFVSGEEDDFLKAIHVKEETRTGGALLEATLRACVEEARAGSSGAAHGLQHTIHMVGQKIDLTEKRNVRNKNKVGHDAFARPENDQASALAILGHLGDGAKRART